jgi:prophage DNA circulation protein
VTWRDNLVPASFRGRDFFIDSHDYEFGRKNIFHDYPFRDDAELEDQGKLTEGFSINAYVLANGQNDFDYFPERDDLIVALSAEGAGQLSHRYLGNKNVAVNGPVRMSERFSEGGIARFQISFKEVKQELPFVTIDPVSSMDIVADDSSDRLLDTYTDIMDITADLQKVSNDITSGMQDIISRVRELKNLPGTVISTATGLVFQAVETVNTVLSSPCDLANSIVGGLDAFLFAAGMLGDAVSRDILGECSGRVQNPDDADRNSDQLSQTEGSAIVMAAVGMVKLTDKIVLI